MSNDPRYIAIGDIHGCLDPLNRLLDALDLRADDELVFLGDYVDRGPDTPGVIARLVELERLRPGTTFLRGNHDAMMMDFLGLSDDGFGESYLIRSNGGHTTLLQYGCPPAIIDKYIETMAVPTGGERRKLLKAIPPAHLDFLSRTVLFKLTPEYLFVHAGINPVKSPKEQSVDDLLWIREKFVNRPHNLPQTIIYGHSPTYDRGFDVRWDIEHRKIGIDTGCVYGGKLTALILPGQRVISVRGNK